MRGIYPLAVVANNLYSGQRHEHAMMPRLLMVSIRRLNSIQR
jgi:hypothetical protein